MKSLVIANWKMNPDNLEKAKRLFDLIKQGVGESKNTEIVICPPYTQFSIFNDQFSKNIKLGAQDCFWKESGPFTGEVSPSMLKNLGCEYVILGHSERRIHLNETDEMINKKVKAALEAGLKPTLCIGETEQEKGEGKTEEILKQQLENTFNIQRSAFGIGQLIIAYEPVWAIGTGNSCKPNDAKKVLLFLRELLADFSDVERPKILYGGSVDSNNAQEYINIGFDGLLVGQASLNPEEFIKIIQKLDK